MAAAVTCAPLTSRADVQSPPSAPLSNDTASRVGANSDERDGSPSNEDESEQANERGYFLDPERGAISFAPEYERWFGDSRRTPRYGRAAIELVGLLALGTGYYWAHQSPNKQDWDYIDIGDRSLNVEVKFDNNLFRTNFLLHPGAGMMSYWLARANGLNIYAATTASVVSSATFEFLLEWLEKPSVNDLIATPLGGIAAGEFFFHLGDYLNSSYGHDNTAQRVLAYSLGAPQGIHSAMDGIHAPLGPRDHLGYTTAYWHRFALGSAIADIANDRGNTGTVYDLLFEGKLVAMPGFLRPGRFSTNFSQGNFTEARLRTSVADGWLKDVDLWFGSDLAGHYRQDFAGCGTALTGSASMLAASVDMRYVDRWLLGRRDHYAFFHFLGPSAKAWLALGRGFTAYSEARLHLDFAGITSPAYRILTSEQGRDGTKTVLQLQDYYQGVGFSGRGAAAIGFAGFEASGYARYGAYRSIDGLDRFSTPRDVANTDQLIEFGAAFSFVPPDAPLTFRLSWERTEHKSQMGPYNASLVDRRAALGTTISF
ncbi:MAG: DUF3943 domain-containing protein [Polyangiaceae bacterium]